MKIKVPTKELKGALSKGAKLPGSAVTSAITLIADNSSLRLVKVTGAGAADITISSEESNGKAKAVSVFGELHRAVGEMPGEFTEVELDAGKIGLRSGSACIRFEEYKIAPDPVPPGIKDGGDFIDGKALAPALRSLADIADLKDTRPAFQCVNFEAEAKKGAGSRAIASDGKVVIAKSLPFSIAAISVLASSIDYLAAVCEEADIIKSDGSRVEVSGTSGVFSAQGSSLEPFPGLSKVLSQESDPSSMTMVIAKSDLIPVLESAQRLADSGIFATTFECEKDQIILRSRSEVRAASLTISARVKKPRTFNINAGLLAKALRAIDTEEVEIVVGDISARIETPGTLAFIALMRVG